MTAWAHAATLCTGNWSVPIVFFGGGNCSAKNNGSTTVSLKASRRCCKVTSGS